MTFKEELEQIKQEGYSFSVSNVVSNSVNLVTKKLLWFSIGFVLIVYVITYIIGSISGPSGYPSEIMEGATPSFATVVSFYSDYFTPLVAVLTFLASIVSYLLYYSYILIAKKADLGEEYSMNDMFSILRSKKRWGFIALLLMIMISVSIASIFLILPGIYLAVATSLAIPIYLYNDDISPMDAIKASISTVNKNFFSILWAQILLGLISMAGIIICCVGILATYNILYAGQYFIYKEIFNASSTTNSDIESIGQIENY
ncbi:MAG: hypothetical protein ACK5MG_07990 [Bacteroidales bacterium]